MTSDEWEEAMIRNAKFRNGQIVRWKAAQLEESRPHEQESYKFRIEYWTR